MEKISKKNNGNFDFLNDFFTFFSLDELNLLRIFFKASFGMKENGMS